MSKAVHTRENEVEGPRYRRGFLETVMKPFHVFAERYIPSAYIFAVVLTVVVAALALWVTPSRFDEVVVGWGDGLSGLLAFTSQMILVLLLGHMLAHTRPVHRLLVKVSSLPRTAGQAYVLVVVITSTLSVFQWGLGLVAAAVLATEVARQGKEKGLHLHFPLLVAAGYSGWVVWGMGYSSSAALVSATSGSFVEEIHGSTIPMSDTVFTSWNLIGLVVAVISVTTALYLARPRNPATIVEVQTSQAKTLEISDEVISPADRMDTSRLPTLFMGLALTLYIVLHFGQGGETTIDIVNWLIMALILLLSRNAREVLALTRNSASNVGDVAFQYPLYAGILGIMASTGLMEWLVEAFVSISTENTFGVLALLSAGIVNVFVPSAGAQFAVQGPILLEAAQSLGVDPGIAVMAVSYGDQWTNMIQPFWALPILAIAGLKIRDILGYTILTLFVSGAVFAAILVVASFV